MKSSKWLFQRQTGRQGGAAASENLIRAKKKFFYYLTRKVPYLLLKNDTVSYLFILFIDDFPHFNSLQFTWKQRCFKIKRLFYKIAEIWIADSVYRTCGRRVLPWFHIFRVTGSVPISSRSLVDQLSSPLLYPVSSASF